MGDSPTVNYFTARAVQVGKPLGLAIEPVPTGSRPEQMLHELEPGRIGENLTERERMLELLRKREHFKSELSSTKDMIRIEKEKTAAFKLTKHLLDDLSLGLHKEARIVFKGNKRFDIKGGVATPFKPKPISTTYSQDSDVMRQQAAVDLRLHQPNRLSVGGTVNPADVMAIPGSRRPVKLASLLGDSDLEKEAFLGIGRAFGAIRGLFGRGAARAVADPLTRRAQVNLSRAAKGKEALVPKQPVVPPPTSIQPGTAAPAGMNLLPTGTTSPAGMTLLPGGSVTPNAAPNVQTGGRRVRRARQPAANPQADVQKQIQDYHAKTQNLAEMSDPEVLRAHGEMTGQKPSWAKQFLASGKGQFAAQMGMMMMPWDKVLEPMGLQDSAVGSVLPLAAFMGAPGLMAKYTGVAKARSALGQNMMAGKWTPPTPMVKTQALDKLFEVKQIVVSTPGVVTSHG